MVVYQVILLSGLRQPHLRVSYPQQLIDQIRYVHTSIERDKNTNVPHQFWKHWASLVVVYASKYHNNTYMVKPTSPS